MSESGRFGEDSESVEAACLARVDEPNRVGHGCNRGQDKLCLGFNTLFSGVLLLLCVQTYGSWDQRAYSSWLALEIDLRKQSATTPKKQRCREPTLA